MKVNVGLYGVFRELGVGEVALEVSDTATVAELRRAFGDLVKKSPVLVSTKIIMASVFATNERVLLESEPISALDSIAILPPVCGG
jgi:molybdopterin converting factor small subunit